MDEAELRAELPWLVNGSLDATQRAQVQAAVGAAPGAMEEQRFLERLRAAVREDAGAGPGELGWRRLRRQIEADVQTARQQRQRGRWQGLAIAASVLMAAQLAWFWALAPQDGHYLPMAAPPAAPAAAVLQLRFQPQATLAQVEVLLQRERLLVIDGPGAAGVWRVQLPAGADAAQVLQGLQVERALIAYAARE